MLTYSKTIECPKCGCRNDNNQQIILHDEPCTVNRPACSNCGLIFSKYYGIKIIPFDDDRNAEKKEEHIYHQGIEIKKATNKVFMNTSESLEQGGIPISFKENHAGNIYSGMWTINCLKIFGWFGLLFGIITGCAEFYSLIYSGHDLLKIIFFNGIKHITIGFCIYIFFNWIVLITESLVEIRKKSEHF